MKKKIKDHYHKFVNVEFKHGKEIKRTHKKVKCVGEGCVHCADDRYAMKTEYDFREAKRRKPFVTTLDI